MFPGAEETVDLADALDGCAFDNAGRSAAEQEAGLQRFGNYELVEEIARGGMGVVYKARQISLNRLVALKMVLAGRLAAPGAVERFRTEAEAVAHLEHPNIVPIYEIGEQDGAQYFTMRLIEGGNLRELSQGRPIPMVRAAEMMVTVARAMEYAHSRGVLHRDLKPANILIDAAGQPHVTDFGLAKLAAKDTGLTRSAMVMGTPNYMAPEQAAGQSKQATAAADIYSLGAILYELLTGLPPFQGETELEVLQRVVSNEPRRPSAIVPKLDRGLETICLKCLEKAPGRRYTSAEDLASDLERWLRHEPIQARPSTLIERAAKWARRRPMQAALAAVIGLSAIILSIFWSDASRQRARVGTATSQTAFKEVDELLGKEQPGNALAQLAHLTRQEPNRRLAAARLLAVLSQRSFALPAGQLTHRDEVLCAEYSADGRWILTASRDQTASVWDAQSARCIWTLVGHHGEVRCARFSPDGKRAVTGSEDRTARVWDLSNGSLLAEFTGHESAVRCVEFSPDGDSILTVASNAVRVWKPGLAGPLCQFTAGQNIVRTARFDPSGERIVTGSQDGLVQIWQTRSGRPTGQSLRHDGSVRSAEFSPDGLRVLTASEEAMARLWSLSSGEVKALSHTGPVSAAHFSPDGLCVLTASQDRQVRLWDSRTGKWLSVALSHPEPVTAAVFSADGLTILSVSDDGQARLWDSQSGAALSEPVAVGRFADGGVLRPDGRQFLTWTSNRFARLWAAPAPACLVKPVPQGPDIHSVTFSPDARTAVLVSPHTLTWWDVFQAQPVGAPQELPLVIEGAQFHPDGKRLLIISSNIVQVGTAGAMHSPRFSLRHDGQVHAASFSMDGRWLVTVCNKTARVWNANSGAAASKGFSHSFPIRAASLSGDGQRLVTVSEDGTARVWTVGSGQDLVLARAQSVLAAEFSRDGQKVVTGAEDGTARVWETVTGRSLVQPLHHPAAVNSAAFSPDGERIVTAAADQSLRIWDANSGIPLADPLNVGDQVWGASFATAGEFVVTQSGLLWEVPAATLPVPAWLPELAEAIGGQRWQRANFVPVEPEGFFRLKQMIQTATATDGYTRWAKWFLADPLTRTISPSSPMTVPQYVQQQIAANNPSGLQEAVRLSPINSSARNQCLRRLSEQN